MASIRLFVTVVFVFLGILPTTSNLLIAQNQPNFLWIMSEDNSKHYLKLFDPSGSETPNIANLAKQGVAFDRAFSNAPVCSVARTTLITMVYGPRLGTQFHRRTELANLPNDWKMFPAYLRDAGYYTTNNSKKDYNAVETNGTWDASSNKAHWRNRPDGKPFFHVQTYTDSHESSLHFKQSWLDAPNNKTDPDSLELAPYHPDTPLFRLTYARYHDRIKSIDNRVGQLVEQLESDGLLENTFIFYFGDHGGVLPRGKGYIYESGLHVPLVVRVPQKWKSLSPFGRGTRTDGFVDFVDFGPTVLKLAGLTVPSFVDGEPFLGSGVTQSEVEARNETLGYADRMDEKYDFCRSIRHGNWKYIRNYQAIYPDGLQNNYRYINLAWRQWRELFNSEKLNPAQSALFPAEAC
jgi:arylsulfatase A-like enzyme